MNPLVLSQAEYEVVFERITRLALDYLATIPERPSFPDVTGRQAQAWFSHDLPEQGMGESAFDDLTRVIDNSRPNSPRFFGYVFGWYNFFLGSLSLCLSFGFLSLVFFLDGLIFFCLVF